MTKSVVMRFVRGLCAALVPAVIDYAATFLAGEPVFGELTPVVVAALLAADKVVRSYLVQGEADRVA